MIVNPYSDLPPQPNEGPPRRLLSDIPLFDLQRLAEALGYHEESARSRPRGATKSYCPGGPYSDTRVSIGGPECQRQFVWWDGSDWHEVADEATCWRHVLEREHPEAVRELLREPPPEDAASTAVLTATVRGTIHKAMAALRDIQRTADEHVTGPDDLVYFEDAIEEVLTALHETRLLLDKIG